MKYRSEKSLSVAQMLSDALKDDNSFSIVKSADSGTVVIRAGHRRITYCDAYEALADFGLEIAN